MASQAPPGEPGRGRVMPHLVLRDFLEESTAASLLEYAIAHESEFTPTLVGDPQGARVDTQSRVSVATRRLRQFGPILRARLRPLTPEFVAALRSMPIDAPKLELQLVAHNDGAFYKAHIDTGTTAASRETRVLSGVYYFHARPKAFTGGVLRLLAIGDPTQSNFLDIEPEHNSLVIFHAWAPHAVMPVACPSRAFGASRFAINCWFYRRRALPGAVGDAQPPT